MTIGFAQLGPLLKWLLDRTRPPWRRHPSLHGVLPWLSFGTAWNLKLNLLGWTVFYPPGCVWNLDMPEKKMVIFQFLFNFSPLRCLVQDDISIFSATNSMKLGKFEANLRAALPHPCAEFRYELSANPRRGSRSTLATHLKVRGETNSDHHSFIPRRCLDILFHWGWFLSSCRCLKHLVGFNPAYTTLGSPNHQLHPLCGGSANTTPGIREETNLAWVRFQTWRLGNSLWICLEHVGENLKFWLFTISFRIEPVEGLLHFQTNPSLCAPRLAFKHVWC